MSNSPVLVSRRSKWPWVFLGILVLIVGLYFILTSSVFLQKVVVPKVGTALGSEVTLAKLDVSPFSSISFSDFRLTPEGGETLVTAKQVVLRYGLMSILKGTIQVDELTLVEPTITIVQGADGKTNLDRLLEGMKSSEPSKPKESSESPQLAIKNIEIRQGILRMTEPRPGGEIWMAEIKNLDLSIDTLANGMPGQLDIAALLTLIDGANARVDASVGGKVDYEIQPDLGPKEAKGSIQVRVDSATGDFDTVANMAIQLQTDVTANEVRQLEVVVSQGGERLGGAGIQGTFDLEKSEARLEYSVAGIDQRVLSLVGAVLGIQLGQTTLAAAGRVDLIQNGKAVSSQGKLSAGSLSVNLGEGFTPELDAELDYRVTLNQENSTALIERIDLLVQQGGREILKGGLDRAMHLAWEGTAPGFRESSFSMDWSDISLSDWKVFLGPEAPAGVVDGNLKMTAEKDGRLLRVALATAIRELTAAIGDAEGGGLRNGNLTVAVNGTLNDFEILTLENFTLDLKQGSTQLASGRGRADWNTDRATGGVQLTMDGSLPAMLSVLPLTDITAQSGLIQVNLQANQRTAESVLIGSINLSDYKGRIGDNVFDSYKASIQANVTRKGNVVELTRTSVALQTGYDAGGSIDFTGRYQIAEQKGALDVKSVNFTHSGLIPFLNPVLAPNQVRSMNIALTAKADIDLAGESGLEGRVAISNLQVNGPDGPVFTEPFALSMETDLTHKDQIVQLRKFLLGWDKTPQANNQVSMVGKLDLNTENRTQSLLTVRSDGIDLTPLAQLKGTPPADSSSGSQPVPPTPTDPTVEPEAIQLPVQPLKVDVELAKVFLREIQVENWKAEINVQNNQVTIDPFRFSLNGAPVAAKVTADLGVPGFRYQMEFSADQVRMEPLVASFAPDQKGKLAGIATANVNLRGAGITGAGLQKNLEGQMALGITNMNLNIGNVQNPILRPILNIVVGLPDMIRNPGAALGNLANRLTGATDAVPGWFDEISQSPLQSLAIDAKAGGGNIRLDQARVQSPALQIDASGTIAIAEVLTNSVLNLPIQVAFKDSLGQKIGLQPQEGQPYIAMPDFLTVGRTAGNPSFDINRTVVAGMAGRAALGIAGGTAEAITETVGDALGNVGNVLGGVLGQGDTNAPATDRNPLGGVLRGLGGLRTNAPATNAPATNAPSAPPRNPLDLLPGFRPRN